MWGVQEGYQLQIEFLGHTLTPVRADRLSLLFGYLFHLGAFISIVYSLHLKDGDRPTVQHTAAVVYAGSALGAVFAGDFITLFVFWELLAVSSVFLIWARRSPRAVGAGMRYLLVHVVSGVTLLAGAMVHAHATGSLEFGEMGLEGLAGWLVFPGLRGSRRPSRCCTAGSSTPTPRRPPPGPYSSARSPPRWPSTPWPAASPARTC